MDQKPRPFRCSFVIRNFGRELTAVWALPSQPSPIHGTIQQREPRRCEVCARHLAQTAYKSTTSMAQAGAHDLQGSVLGVHSCRPRTAEPPDQHIMTNGATLLTAIGDGDSGTEQSCAIEITPCSLFSYSRPTGNYCDKSRTRSNQVNGTP